MTLVESAGRRHTFSYVIPVFENELGLWALSVVSQHRTEYARLIGDNPSKCDPIVQPLQQFPCLKRWHLVRKRNAFLKPGHLEPDAPLSVIDESVVDVEPEDIWMPSAKKRRLLE